MDQLKQTIEQIIRPALASHNGDLKVMGVENGVVKIKLTGACSGCPSAGDTTRLFIEEQLKAHVPGIQSVELIEGVSSDLMDLARELLSKKENE